MTGNWWPDCCQGKQSRYWSRRRRGKDGIIKDQFTSTDVYDKSNMQIYAYLLHI